MILLEMAVEVISAIVAVLGVVFVATRHTNDTGSVSLCAVPIVVGAVSGVVHRTSSIVTAAGTTPHP